MAELCVLNPPYMALISLQVSTEIKRFPRGSDGKESDCTVGDQGSVPGSGRFPGEGNGNPLQHSRLENPRDRGACRATQSMGLERVGHDLATSIPLHSVGINDRMSLCVLKKGKY